MRKSVLKELWLRNSYPTKVRQALFPVETILGGSQLNEVFQLW